MNKKHKYIVIEGNIGAGKTTLAKKTATDFNAKLILEEFQDNPFLPKFYKNPERYSFTLELSFLAARYKQLNKEITNIDLFTDYTIADYYFVKSLIFSRSTLEDDEYNLYRQLFNIIYQQLPLPDLYVYLHVNPEKLLANIAQRGRDYEKDITAEYLYEIQGSYFEYFKTEKRFPIVIIETSEIDFVSNKNHYHQLVDHIFNNTYNAGINRIHLK